MKYIVFFQTIALQEGFIIGKQLEWTPYNKKTIMTSTIDKFKSTLKHWYVPLIIGILLILLGIISIMTPLATYVAISMFISVAFLFTGILQIVFAVSNRNDIDGWGWQLAAGIIYTLLGLYIVINPAITMVTLPFVIAFFTFIQAIFGIATAIEFQQIKLKGWGWMLFWAILGLIFFVDSNF